MPAPAVPLCAGLAVLVGGALVFALRSPTTARPAALAASAGQGIADPRARRRHVSLAAKEETNVRATGVVPFDGILRAGQRQSWDGETPGLAVDGRDLGPYSPAMGHADWNRIDYSFWPGWSQPQVTW